MPKNPLKQNATGKTALDDKRLDMSATNEGAVTLVTACNEKMLDWVKGNGVFNYPIKNDEQEPEAYARIKELWLYVGSKAKRHCFATEFAGIQTKEEFMAAYPTCVKPWTGRYTRCVVFKTEILAYGPELEFTKVFARASDFPRGHSKEVVEAIKQFNADANFAPLADYLPNELSKLPREQLHISESAVQLEFLMGLTKTINAGDIPGKKASKDDIRIEFGDSLQLCDTWLPPTVIVSDGPYGLGSYPGDPSTPDGLAEFYRPFLVKWYERALPSTTLWFWNSEQGWANCHRMIEDCGWEFRNCHIWNKGMSHVAGNCNTKTIRKYPVVTEVCAQYVRKNYLSSGGVKYRLKEWMRAEWQRTRLPFRMTNVACGVKDAATRKYFSTDHLWYFPPAEAFVRISAYANEHGNISGKPYFAKPDGCMFTENEWELMRAKFHCEIGVSNVWDLPAVRGEERIKKGSSCLHMNQKPLKLLEMIIRSSSDPGDVVWEPFGGLCSAAVAALRTGRKAFAAEINPKFFNTARERIENEG